MSEKKPFNSFDTMITPQIITLVFWLVLAGIVVGGVFMVVSGSVMSGLGAIVFGGVFWRIWCELMIVFFKINENIQRIADRGDGTMQG